MVATASRTTAAKLEADEQARSDANSLATARQRETAQYVADMILELRNMAKAVKLHSVAAPLEYAYYEAFSVANRVVPSAAEIERIKELSRAAVADHAE